MVITLDAHGYRLRLSPRFGATILSLEWRQPDGSWLPLFEPLHDPAQAMQAGCFLMAPFANRIVGGRFTFAGRSHRMALNRPEHNVAIHGFSRDRPWRVIHHAQDEVRLEDGVDAVGQPWRYGARLDVALTSAGPAITLTLRNDGPEPLPFGIGLHPFFPRDAGTTIAFEAEGCFTPGPDGLPALPFQPAVAVASGQPVALDRLAGLDQCYRNWTPRRLRLLWPARGTGVDLEADGAFRHLHLFIPRDRPVVCAEPVSHLPDAVNRSELGASAMMTALDPGQSLAGTLRLEALTPERLPTHVQT